MAGASTAVLRRGLIAEIAQSAGLELRGRGAKRQLRCPFHDDRSPSAVIWVEENTFYCSSCAEALSAKRFAERLGAMWIRGGTDAPFEVGERIETASLVSKYRFTREMARQVWIAALERARNDDVVEEDRLVYDYVTSRGLSGLCLLELYGVLHPDMRARLPRSVGALDERSPAGLSTLRRRNGRDSKCAGEVYSTSAGSEIALPAR